MYQLLTYILYSGLFLGCNFSPISTYQEEHFYESSRAFKHFSDEIFTNKT